MQSSKGQIAFLLLSLLTIGIGVYLTIVHYAHSIPICPNTGGADCAAVLASSYALIPGTTLPITWPGLAWGLISAGLALAAWRSSLGARRLLLAECIWCLLGVCAALYLVYVEVVKLNTICLWCTALHITILTMFLLTLVLLLQPEASELDEERLPAETRS